MAENKIRILVVDDEPDLVETIQFFIEEAGYEVKTASGGNEAAKLVQNEHFALVLTDVRMPVGNGLDLLKFVRLTNPMTRVVMMSAYTDTTEEEFIRLGAVGFLSKPIDFDSLGMDLKRFMNA